MMTLREMMLTAIAEFEIASGKTVSPDELKGLSDKDIIQMFRNNVWDEAYTDGHVEGYFKGIDHEREIGKKTNSKVKLN